MKIEQIETRSWKAMRTPAVKSMFISLLVMPFLFGGCAGPTIRAVSGNERYVVFFDSCIPGYCVDKGEGLALATKWCQQFGRIARFQGRGGDAEICATRGRVGCTTYVCAE